MNIAQVLREQAVAHGPAAALIDVRNGRDRTITFSELDAATARTAAQLKASGISAGDAVLILHPPSIELYVFLLAIFRLGAIGMFLDPSAGRTHMERCCTLHPPKAFFGSWKAYLLLLTTPSLRKISLRFCSTWFPGTHRIAIRANGPELPEIAPCPDPSPALLTLTSGSTGQAKAALRTHAFLLAQHRALEASLHLRPGTVDLTTLPVFVLANLASAVTSVLPNADMRRPGNITAEPVLQQLNRHAIATTAASPAFLTRLAEHCEQTSQRIPGMRHVFLGGAPVFPRDLRRAARIFPNAEITAVYGSTEAEPMAEVSLSQISEADFRAMNSGKGLLAGIPVPSLSLRILLRQWGKPLGSLTAAELDALTLAPLETGEIVVSGKHVLSGYLGGEGNADTKFDADGKRWHRTGDLGYLDAEGRLWLMGRAAAAIQDERGVLYPFAVECAALQIDGVIRTALVQIAGRRILAVEVARPEVRSKLQEELAWASLDEVRSVPAIPMDKRHNAKVDYGALIQLLQSGTAPLKR